MRQARDVMSGGCEGAGRFVLTGGRCHRLKARRVKGTGALLQPDTKGNCT